MLRINNLHKSYIGTFTLSVSEIGIPGGRVTAILGPNGSGKSTLLRILAGIEKAESGTISFNGKKIHAGSIAPVSWRRSVTLVMQAPYLFRGTVLSNIAFGLKVRGYPLSRCRQKIGEALVTVGLEGFEGRRGSELSGGEAQRVAIGRALALDTELLLLDEPTANVDRENVGRIEQLISSLSGRKGLTVLLATHNLDQAYRLANEVVSFIGGKVVPARPENIFKASVEDRGNGLKLALLRDGLELEVDTSLSGRVHLAIDPTDIIVSRKKLESSARNVLAGLLRSVASHGKRVRLTVDAGLDISVFVTEQSYREMKLHPGDAVFLTFKTTAVRVF